GTGGATYDVIGFAPSLNNAGQVGVFGSLEGSGVNASNRLGSWDGALGSVQLVMRTGSPAPQYPGATFESTGRPVATDSGALLIPAGVLDPARPSGHGAGIWFGPADNLQLVIKQGGAAPNSPA